LESDFFIFSNSSFLFEIVKVKLAFGDDDDDHEPVNNQEILDENNPASPNSNTDKNNSDTHFDRSYQQDFFTIHNTTVEVILENDTLSWSTVTGESQYETSRRKSTNRDDGNSVRLQDVFAITPIHTNWNWSLDASANVAGTTVSTADTITSSVAPPSSTSSENSVLRGFQLHSHQPLEDNIVQEILIIFQSNDSTLIERWYNFLSKIISESQWNLNLN
jgi:hypothetical protein